MSKISCQINLFKPPDEVFKPGEVVTGVIKYVMLESMAVRKITTSLQGIGNIVLVVHKKKQVSYTTKEVLIDVDNVVQEGNMKMSSGDSNEFKFSFTLPHKIPSTSKVDKRFGPYEVKCFFEYYIRVKFEGPGVVASQRFKKLITIVSNVAPRLPKEPITYGKTKKLVRLLSLTQGFIKIKATILNSALPMGDKIQIHYEVENNSHVIVKSILTKLIEAYTFNVDGHSAVTYEEDVPDTEAIVSAVNCQETRNEAIEINVTPDRCCLENSKLVSRNHLIRIVAELPLPHGSIVLDVPVQIGVTRENTENIESTNEDTDNDPPPSYWEAMGEGIKEDDDTDDDNENGKSHE